MNHEDKNNVNHEDQKSQYIIPVSKIYQSYKRNISLVKRTPMIKSNYLS